ncbi:hypothetical protein N7497_003579 [Penicillium chrysogenum]|nr:hypothetical protein N7497_003579 [Penicillium chrysogenum]
MLSSDNAYMNTQSTPQTLPLRPYHQYPGSSDARGYYNPYDERTYPTSGHARDYESHRSWTYDVESQHSSSSTAMPSPVWSDKSAATHAFNPILPNIHQDPKPQSRNANYRMPHGFDKLLHPEPEPQSPSPPPPPRRPSTQSRYHLHIRQQPIAARACGAGDRDRRPVDPPPIVQILLTDFDSNSQEDRDLLQDPRFTKHIHASAIRSEIKTGTETAIENENENTKENENEKEKEKQMASPAQTTTSQPHYYRAKPLCPPSTSTPTQTPTPLPHTHPPYPILISPTPPHHVYNHAASRLHQPATFFIFADLSIRSAGLYRLQFRLMNWGSVEDTGQSMPILAQAWSDPFRVYPAKDFPGMRDSSILAEGLKELGFVELKTRGHGKGKGKKRR